MNFLISDYLENRQESYGICKACKRNVQWSKNRVASHKRNSCIAATQEERDFFSRPSAGSSKLPKNNDELKIISNNKDLLDIKVNDLPNHKEKCRLCISDVEEDQSKVKITENVRPLISLLQIEVCLNTFRNF